mgnify:FL=1
MPITYFENEDLFAAETDALVNPVNCAGAMGKGIAKEFKKQFPECFKPYKEACDNNLLRPGKLIYIHVDVQPTLFENKRPSIILFPTKEHWRGKSKIDWIEAGLRDLRNHYQEWGIESIAMPALGCGYGQLEWPKVRELIEEYFSNEPILIQVYFSSTNKYENSKLAVKPNCKQ